MGLMDIRRRILADAPVLAEASGAVASFQTDMAVPLKSCQFGIEPVQSGTGDPSPSNVRPISGWTGVAGQRTGKNLLRQLTVADFDNAETYGLSTYVKIPLPKGTYTVSTNAPTGYIWAGKNTINPNYQRVYSGNPFTITLGDGDTEILVGILTTDKSTSLSYSIQLEVGSSATAYEPFAGDAISVTFPAQGKNLFDQSQFLLATDWAVDANGYYYGTRRNFSAAFGNGFSKLPQFEPNTRYTISLNGYNDSDSSSTNIYIFYTNNTSNVLQIEGTTATDYTFTTASNKTISKITGSYGSTGNAVAYIKNFQLEKGSTATAYEPYTNTVYGGTVDVTTGVLTVTWAKIVLNGTETWTSSGGLYTGVPTLAKLRDYSNAIYADKLNTSIYQTSMSANSITGYKDISERYPNNNWIYAKVDGVTTAADITAWLAQNPVEVVYQLAHHIIYQLTPQQINALKGQNNVWNTCGDTSVTYWKH